MNPEEFRAVQRLARQPARPLIVAFALGVIVGAAVVRILS